MTNRTRFPLPHRPNPARTWENEDGPGGAINTHRSLTRPSGTSRQEAAVKATRTSSEAIVNAYRETGSVWRAGKRLGIAGQTVHDRLVALRYPLVAPQWSAEELDELRTLYADGVNLSEISSRLGRSYAGVACKANRIGLHADQRRPKEPLRPRPARRPPRQPRGPRAPTSARTPRRRSPPPKAERCTTPAPTHERREPCPGRPPRPWTPDSKTSPSWPTPAKPPGEQPGASACA